MLLEDVLCLPALLPGQVRGVAHPHLVALEELCRAALPAARPAAVSQTVVQLVVRHLKTPFIFRADCTLLFLPCSERVSPRTGASWWRWRGPTRTEPGRGRRRRTRWQRFLTWNIIQHN